MRAFRSPPPPRCGLGRHRPSGFVLPIAITSSSILLLSSLSLHTLALQMRQRARQQWHVAQRRDALLTAAMHFAKRSRGQEACLLAWPSDQWDASTVCPAAEPNQLRAGRMASLPWRLQRWQPNAGSGGWLSLLWADGSLTRQWLEVSP